MGTEASVSAIPTVAPARSGRFALNLATNVGKLGLTMVVGAWYVPFLVRQLGPAAYGLIPLASMLTSYMALITFGVDAALCRSLAISLERKDDGQSNRIFNAAFWANVALVALLALPAIAAVINVEHLMRIPAGYETATRWLLAGTIAAFFLNQVRTPFAASCFVLNRLDLQNLGVVAETLTRVGLVACLFLGVAPRIEYVGGAILGGTVVGTFGAIWFWKLLTPSLRVRWRDFDWPTARSLCHTGGWVIVSQIGVMLYLNTDLVLANRLFGPEESGRYAALLQMAVMLTTLGMAVGEIFAPTMYQKYARGNLNELAAYLNRAIKFLGLVMALAIGLICGFARPLLQLWLGPSFGGLALLLILMAIHLSLNLAMYPLYAVPLAANRVKVPGLVTLGIGGLNVVLALLLTKVFGWGLYGLAVAVGISLTLRRLVFTPLYVAAVLHQPCWTYYRTAVPILGATLATMGAGWLISWNWDISNWVNLAIAAAAVSLLYLAAVCLLLAPEERAAVKEVVVRWRD